jgi:predicted AAA+ superfamily ATPase
LIQNSQVKRYLSDSISKELPRKMILLSGPRQAGKTTMSKMLKADYAYLNYDESEQRQQIQEKSWDRKKSLIILDEIHKMPNWKSWLKGVFDTEGLNPPLLVTGSAKLETMKKVGDSMAGRYFAYRLHPIDIKEASALMTPEKALDRIMQLGGFPEPFLSNELSFYKKWRKTHLENMIRNDLISLQLITDMVSLENLVELLKTRVGAPVSYLSLAQDLQKDPKTIKQWLEYLESLYIIFSIRPWHYRIQRSLLKTPKYYFYDVGQVKEEGPRLENLVACALLKEIHFQEDVFGETMKLHYVRNKEGKEIDFAVSRDQKLERLFEVKTKDDVRSPQWNVLGDEFLKVQKIQLVKQLKNEKTFRDGLEIRDLAKYLSQIDFCEK